MQNQLRCIKTVALKLSPLGTMCCSIPLLLMFHLSVAKNGKLQGTGTSERLCAASISSAVDAKGWGVGGKKRVVIYQGTTPGPCWPYAFTAPKQNPSTAGTLARI